MTDVIKKLEEEHRYDLALHLYSAHLLRRHTNLFFPKQSWTAWPVSRDRVHIPESNFVDSTALVQTMEEVQEPLQSAEELLEAKMKRVMDEQSVLSRANRTMFANLPTSTAVVHESDDELEANEDETEDNNFLIELDEGDSSDSDAAVEIMSPKKKKRKSSRPHAPIKRDHSKMPDPLPLIQEHLNSLFERNVYHSVYKAERETGSEIVPQLDFDSVKLDERLQTKIIKRLDTLMDSVKLENNQSNGRACVDWKDILAIAEMKNLVPKVNLEYHAPDKSKYDGDGTLQADEDNDDEANNIDDNVDDNDDEDSTEDEDEDEDEDDAHEDEDGDEEEDEDGEEAKNNTQGDGSNRIPNQLYGKVQDEDSILMSRLTPAELEELENLNIIIQPMPSGQVPSYRHSSGTAKILRLFLNDVPIHLAEYKQRVGTYSIREKSTRKFRTFRPQKPLIVNMDVLEELTDKLTDRLLEKSDRYGLLLDENIADEDIWI